MAHVDILVAGRSYQLACRDGDEPALRALGEQIDVKAADARRVLGAGASEGRLLLLTAIMLADEANDLRAALDRAQAAPSTVPQAEEIVALIETIAERLESLTADLESSGTNP